MKNFKYLVRYLIPDVQDCYFIREAGDYVLSFNGQADVFTENDVLNIIKNVEDVRNLKIIKVFT